MPDTMLGAPADTLRIAEADPATRFLLRGDPATLGRQFGIALPQTPCTVTTEGDRAALWLGPDEWLLLAPPGTDLPLWDGEDGAAFDVTHRQRGLRVEGTRATDLLATECPLDLATYPDGFCTRTVLCKAEIVVWRQSPTAYHLEIWRSFTPYVQALLTRTARSLP